jgi:type IV pilus assembly protein PilO
MKSLQLQTQWCNRAQWGLGVTLAVLAMGFYTFVFRPNNQRLDDLRTQIQSKQRDLNSNKTRVQILPDVMRAVTDMTVRLESFNKQMPKQPDLGPFINDITELSHQASLRKVFVEPGMPQRSELYAEWPIALKFEGDFLSAFTFLRRAEEMQRLTRVRTLKVQSTDGGKTGQVQVELSMNIYFSEG